MASRPFLFVVASVLAVVPGWSGPERLALFDGPPAIRSTRVALDPGHPARRRLGRLTFMGGVALASDDPAFGGFSSLAVRGDRVTLLSDGGNLVRFRLHGDGGVSDVRAAALPGGPGTGWEKRDRDSESMAIDPVTGTAWVGFERANAIYRYDRRWRRVERSVRPAAMARWESNGGPETLVRRRDGSFVVLAETSRGGRSRAGLVFARDPTLGDAPAFRFGYRPQPGYDPSDATELPDGRLLVLSRRWRAPLRFASMLEVVDGATLKRGRVVRGRVIAALAAPLTHDNFEGVAATIERGRTIVWLVSDDNQMPFERSLLLKFRLDD